MQKSYVKCGSYVCEVERFDGWRVHVVLVFVDAPSPALAAEKAEWTCAHTTNRPLHQFFARRVETLAEAAA